MAVSKGQCITAAQVFSVNLAGAAISMEPAGVVVEFAGDGIWVYKYVPELTGNRKQGLGQSWPRPRRRLEASPYTS